MISNQQPSNTQTNTNSHTPLSLFQLSFTARCSPSLPVLTRRVLPFRETLRTLPPRPS